MDDLEHDMGLLVFVEVGDSPGYAGQLPSATDRLAPHAKAPNDILLASETADLEKERDGA